MVIVSEAVDKNVQQFLQRCYIECL